MLREDVEAVTGDGNGFMLHLPSSHFDLIIFLVLVFNDFCLKLFQSRKDVCKKAFAANEQSFRV